MPTASRRPPLDGTDRVIVDGTNLLWRLGAKSGGPAPASAIVARLRAAIPVAIAIDLVFDGMGQGVFGRLAQNMLVRYSGKQSADDTILDLVSEAAMQGVGGPAAADRILVVTGDRPLRDRVTAKGARSVPLQWLIARLDVPIQSQHVQYTRVRIGRNSWVGNSAVVMADVGADCVVGAGSVKSTRTDVSLARLVLGVAWVRPVSWAPV